MSFFRILVSHVDNAVSLGDRWFHTLEYNTVITKCLNLIMFLADSFQGICKQSHWTEQTGLKLLLRTSKAFSFTVTQGREGWLKIENIPRDYAPLTLLPILYLSHLSPNQVSDYLCFHPYILKWLRKNCLQKIRIHKETETYHSMSWGNKHFSCGENLSILMLSFQGASWSQFVKSFNSAQKSCIGIKTTS